MATFKKTNGASIVVPDESLADFNAEFRGELIFPGDPTYDGARRLWNSLIDKHPAMIARCTGVADVVEAVQFARRNQLSIAVRGGGHNVSGSGSCDGGVVIDLSMMRAVHIDHKRRSIYVQGGATLAEIDRETAVHGWVTTTGNVSATGIGGLTLGGGFGNLRRKFGLGIDNLLSAEVVTAQGEVVYTDASEHPELFWALRGGGGNFGVVTTFGFKAHELGPELYFTAQFFPIEDAIPAMTRWRDFMASAPDEVSSTAFFWTIPRAEGFPKSIHGKRVFLYGALYAGPATDGEKVLKPLMHAGEPILDLSGTGPYTQWQQAFDPFFLPGDFYKEIYAYWKSVYLNGLDNELIADLVKRAEVLPSEQCLMAIWQLGGAMARIPESSTAFGKRSAPFLLSYDSCWTDPSQSNAVIEWTRKQIADATPFSPGGLYLNFPGVGENNEELVKQAYGANYERLAQAKRLYDPVNLFRVNQNILPAEL